jgi:hypothetical protein
MKAARRELLKRLPKHGWSLERIEDSDLEWWADEIWVLKPVWLNHPGPIYLTFLVDPQSDTPLRKKGQGIWTVKASLKRPTDWLTEAGDIYWELGDWQRTLPKFLEELPALLTDVPERGAIPDG